jgi:hypothetical protein
MQTLYGFAESAQSPQGQVGDCKVQHISYDAHHFHLMTEDYASEDPSQKV